MDELKLFLFHRHGGGDNRRGVGTERDAREFLRRLNAGRTESLFSMRAEKMHAFDIAAALAEINQRKD